MNYICRNIRKEYDGKEILSLSELHLPLGKTTVIMGPNGAGKTSLLRILAFLETDYFGDLLVAGEKVGKTLEGTKKFRRRSGVIWQRPVMYNMSVRANVALGLRLRRVKAEEAEAKVDAILAKLGLTQLAHVNAKRLSGGETQKVSIARALVVDPEFIFVDEPSSNLDIEAIELMHRLLLEEKEKGKTIVLITHNLAEAKRLGDYLVFLNQGQVLASGELPEVFSAPALTESPYWRYI
ncbi:MAG: ATP-binding cassette domain-containing protein [Firmicutes bacterium]|nr:ATP-binding cassette domain-containing protein [Bacillota bacterium]